MKFRANEGRLAGPLSGLLSSFLFFHLAYASDPPKAPVDADGTVHVPALTVPFSRTMSPRARAIYMERTRAQIEHHPGDTIVQDRAQVDDYYRKFVERGRPLYPVNIESKLIGGVKVDVVTPKTGVSERNKSRVLINLHGGGMMVGAGLGGITESMPIASIGKIKVVSVDYRMAPEYKFPAASEDVVAVYRALLQQYRPQNIGIYGCSSGGLLTAETVAWIRKLGLPNPGAIGLFCSGADANFESSGGDSFYTASAIGSFGWEAVSGSDDPQPKPDYYSQVDLNDPLVSPAQSLNLLAKFPPTLLISGVRDQSMSSVVYTHARLVQAGVEADLHIWDGMWHSFLFEMDMPESIEAYNVIVKFFDKHLGRDIPDSRNARLGTSGRQMAARSLGERLEH